MSSLQISCCWRHTNSGTISVSNSKHSLPRVNVSPVIGIQLPQKRLRLVCNAARRRKYSPVCLYDRKGRPASNNGFSPWKALENLMGGLKKELTMQDILRERNQLPEFDDDGGGNGGSGKRPGGGGGNEFGNPEDYSLLAILDEALQVILAALGLLFVYIYIINGPELTLLFKDYIKYLARGRQSVRLRKAMFVWRRFKKRLKRKKKAMEDENEDSLAFAILNTPTYWYKPWMLQQMLARDSGRKLEPSKETDTWWYYFQRASRADIVLSEDDSDDSDSDEIGYI